ncbi:MAG: cytochrome c oxidase subunit II, partial [Actinomycetota bacterium]
MTRERATSAPATGARATRSRRLLALAVPAMTVLCAGACSGSFGMPRGASEQAQETFEIWQIFFIAAIPVAGIVYVLIAWSLVRYRRRRSDDPDALGSQRAENIPLEIVYTAVPIIIVIVLFVLAIRTDDRVTAISSDPDLVVRVEAFAWGWRFAYPDGVTVVSPPSGEDATEPVLMLPNGRTIRFSLTSNDTIHAFWVPEFLYKHDAIPGRTFEFDVTPTD